MDCNDIELVLLFYMNFIMDTLNCVVHHLVVKSLYVPLSNWVVRKICII
jgi:hypothetical protein